MYKGRVSRSKAIQLYREMQLSTTPPAVWQNDVQNEVVEYVPATEIRDRVTASQIIHTQNIHHHHHYTTPEPTPVAKTPPTQATSEEFFWLSTMLGMVFTVGFLIAVLIRG